MTTEGLIVGLTQMQADNFRTAKPFPHIVVDDFFEPAALRDGVKTIPASGKQWQTHVRQKKSLNRVRSFAPELSRLFDALHTPQFIAALEQMSGIPKLLGDPDWLGAGIHSVPPGGGLTVHLDFNVHPRLNWYRRLNCFLYLNEDWQSEWFGQLWLCNPADKTKPEVKIEPSYNRFVCFQTSGDSWHGHPENIACPAGRSRMSLAWYYYTKEEPENFEGRHLTIWAK